jgi:hypothetical protein
MLALINRSRRPSSSGSERASTEPPQTCGENVDWHLREYRGIYIFITTSIILAGVGLLTAGCFMCADPNQRTTVSAEYTAYLKDHAAFESDIMRATTITIANHTAVKAIGDAIPFRFVAEAKGTVTRDDVVADTYWSVNVPRPQAGLPLTVELNTTVAWQGAVITSGPISLPSVELTQGSYHLTEACFVIDRTASLHYTASEEFTSCFYPYSGASHHYGDEAESPYITLSFRSGYSPYVTMLQRFGKGDLNDVRDEEVFTSSTPLTFIGVGAATCVAGLLMLIALIVRFGPNPPHEGAKLL